MEKDETVSDSSPHIANIGRLVEVRLWSHCSFSLLQVPTHIEELCVLLAFGFTSKLMVCTVLHPVVGMVLQQSVDAEGPSAPGLLLSRAAIFLWNKLRTSKQQPAPFIVSTVIFKAELFKVRICYSELKNSVFQLLMKSTGIVATFHGFVAPVGPMCSAQRDWRPEAGCQEIAM